MEKKNFCEIAQELWNRHFGNCITYGDLEKTDCYWVSPYLYALMQFNTTDCNETVEYKELFGGCNISSEFICGNIPEKDENMALNLVGYVIEGFIDYKEDYQLLVELNSLCNNEFELI